MDIGTFLDQVLHDIEMSPRYTFAHYTVFLCVYIRTRLYEILHDRQVSADGTATQCAIVVGMDVCSVFHQVLDDG